MSNLYYDPRIIELEAELGATKRKLFQAEQELEYYKRIAGDNKYSLTEPPEMVERRASLNNITLPLLGEAHIFNDQGLGKHIMVRVKYPRGEEELQLSYYVDAKTLSEINRGDVKYVAQLLMEQTVKQITGFR